MFSMQKPNKFFHICKLCMIGSQVDLAGWMISDCIMIVDNMIVIWDDTRQGHRLDQKNGWNNGHKQQIIRLPVDKFFFVLILRK